MRLRSSSAREREVLAAAEMWFGESEHDLFERHINRLSGGKHSPPQLRTIDVVKFSADASTRAEDLVKDLKQTLERSLSDGSPASPKGIFATPLVTRTKSRLIGSGSGSRVAAMSRIGSIGSIGSSGSSGSIAAGGSAVRLMTPSSSIGSRPTPPSSLSCSASRLTPSSSFSGSSRKPATATRTPQTLVSASKQRLSSSAKKLISPPSGASLFSDSSRDSRSACSPSLSMAGGGSMPSLMATPSSQRSLPHRSRICSLPGHVKREVLDLFDGFALQQQEEAKRDVNATPSDVSVASGNIGVSRKLKSAGSLPIGGDAKAAAVLSGAQYAADAPKLAPTKKSFEQLLRLYHKMASADEIEAMLAGTPAAQRGSNPWTSHAPSARRSSAPCALRLAPCSLLLALCSLLLAPCSLLLAPCRSPLL